jgi:hypothetical protein
MLRCDLDGLVQVGALEDVEPTDLCVLSGNMNLWSALF